MWADTVLASKSAIGMCIYIGKETRMSMSKKKPRVKVGQTDNDLNFTTKILFGTMVVYSLFLFGYKIFM